MHKRNGQLASIDIVLSTLIILILISLLIVFITRSIEITPRTHEGDLIHTNAGLIKEYRLDPIAVTTIAGLDATQLRARVLASSRYPSTSDICILMTDGSGIVNMEGHSSISTNPTGCDLDTICTTDRVTRYPKSAFHDGSIYQLTIYICR